MAHRWRRRLLVLVGSAAGIALLGPRACRMLPRPPQTGGNAAMEHTNRLIHEKSPYLLQHAHNPVDWYPWGPEAFERARREDKPIFLCNAKSC